jgi:hypothetical protein
VRLSFVGVAAKCQRLMAVSHLGKAGVSSPAIGAQDRTERDVVFDKAGKSVGAPIRHDAKSQAPRIDTASVLLAVILTRPDLDSTHNYGLVMRAATFAARLAADHAFIDFDRMLAADGVAFWANHASAELVEDLKGRLVATERKLALELDGGLSRNLRSHEIRAPKPRRERCMARLHDGASRKRCIGFASTTSQHDRRASCETVRLSYKTAFRARKSARPTNGFKVAGTSRIIGEYPLKLRKRSWEAANVHTQDNSRSLRLCQTTG